MLLVVVQGEIERGRVDDDDDDNENIDDKNEGPSRN